MRNAIYASWIYIFRDWKNPSISDLIQFAFPKVDKKVDSGTLTMLSSQTFI